MAEEIIEEIAAPEPVQPPTDKTKLLYDAVSKKYDVGGYDEFAKKLQDPNKRKAFYEGVGKEYELGTYDEFTNKVGAVKKKDTPLPASDGKSNTGSPLPASKLQMPFPNVLDRQRSDNTTAVKPQRSYEVEKLVKTLPSLKKAAVKNATLNLLAQQGKAPLEGTNDYNALAPTVEHNLRDEDWMPSGLVPQHKEEIKKHAILDFASANKEKPEDVEANLQSGKYLLDNGKVKEVGGFGDNFRQGVVDFVDNVGLAMNVSAAQSRGNNNEIKYHLNQFNEKKKYDREFGATDLQGKTGKLLGGLTPYVAGGAVMPFADVPMMGLSNMGAMQQEIWNDNKLSDDEKVKAINGASTDAFMTGALQGAAFHGIGKVSENPTASKLLSNYAPTAALKKTFTQKLYNGYSELLKTTPQDVTKAAAIGGGTELINDLTKTREGVKVDFSNVPQGALEMAALDLFVKAPKVLTTAFSTLKAAKNTGYDKANPKWYNSYSKETQDALNNIVSAPKGIYDEAIAQLDKSPDPEALNAKAKIEKFRSYYNELPYDLPKSVKDKALHIIQLKTEAIGDAQNITDSGIKSHYEKKARTYDALLDKLLTEKDVNERSEPLLISRFADPNAIPKTHDQLTKQEREGIVVPKEHGYAEVEERGEGENKTYVPKAYEIIPDGGLEKSKPIKIDTEGKTFKDKDKAQKAADEALGKHYYENGMSELEKPLAKEVKEPKSEEPLPSTVNNEPLKDVENTFSALSEIDKVSPEHINKLMDLISNDYSIASLAKSITDRSKIKFEQATDEEMLPFLKAKSPKDILSLIKYNGKIDTNLRNVASVFLDNYHKIEPFIKFKIDLARDRDGYPVSANGSYGGGRIDISKSAFWKNKNHFYRNGIDNASHTILHEFTHAFTLDAYRKPKTQLEKDFHNYINKQFNELKSNSAFKDSYGFTKPEEFIAEILTNEEFRKSAPIYKSGILDKIIEYIAKIFNYRKDVNAASDARYQQVKDTFNYILKSIPEIRAGKGKEIFYESPENIRRISEAYHKAKKEGNNPELIKEVERLFNETKQDKVPKPTEGKEPITEKGTEVIEPTSTGEKVTEETVVEPPKPPIEPPVSEPEAKEPAEFGNKAILKRLSESENIKPEIREKFKDNLKYQVKSHEEARSVAKEVINEYGHEEAAALAEAGKFHGDVNSMIFGEALDQLYQLEKDAKTPQEKIKYATQWADIAMRYDEAARSGGRFISAIGDFYRKSPLGIQLKEEANRSEAFKDWYKTKEKDFKDVFEAIKNEPEFKDIVSKEVQEQMKKEREANRDKRRKNIEDFFDKAKFKGDATYATIIPPKVINGALEVMKQAFLAGESVANAVEQAISHISKEIEDWDKEKFRKEYEEKLSKLEGKKKFSPEELSEQKKQRILDQFRKKLKGISEKEKEEVIRKSFKKLVDNGALEYEDFKKIIAETIGLGKLEEADKEKIENYVKDINAVQDLADAAREKRTQPSLDAFHKAAKKAEKSATELGGIVYNKPQIINRITGIMQLNTLGIPSLVNNPIFNIVNQSLVRFPKAVQLSILDKAIQLGGKMFGKDIPMNNNVLSAQIPFFKGVGKGAAQSAEQMFTGLTNKDYFQKEVYASQIKPWTSIKELWAWGKCEKHLSKSQVADKALQGTVGVPAEMVARLLNVGDKPQRFATEQAAAKAISDQYGLKGMDEKLFMEFPKQEAYRLERAKGVPENIAMKRAEEIESRIIKEGEESTFQQDNIVSDMLASIGKAYDKVADGEAPLQFAGQVGKILKTMNLPFVKIPLNAFWSYFNLVNPEVALAQSLAYGASAAYKKAKGIEGAGLDFEKSKKWAAHATTGLGLLAMTATLASKGIVSGDNNSKDTKKEREGEKFYEQQHSMDMSKLFAYMQGKDPNDVKSGLKVYLKWFGVMGNAANLQANKYEGMDEEQRKNGIQLTEDILGGNMIPSALELFESGVFSNASSLANAFDKGGVYGDTYLTNLINMGSNVVHPAMFAQLSRAKLPYDYTTKADTFREQVANNMAARSEWVRKLADKYPPTKIGIWGDDLRRSDNTSDIALRWFGMSYANQDAFARPLYEDYKKTGDVGFFPPAVKPEIDKQKLNTEETRQLETLVGKARQKLIAPYVNGYATLPGFDEKYSKLSIEDKKAALQIIYEQGYEQGKEQFLNIHPKYRKSEDWNAEEKKEQKSENKTELRDNLKQ